MKKNATLIFGALLVCAGTFFSSGCGTIFGGIRQSVEISSSPSGAEIFVNGKNAGTTPATLELFQQKPPLLVLKKEGYADTRVQIERGVSGWLAMNLLLGPLFPVGLVLDFRAGTEKTYNETEIVVPLLAPGDAPRSLYGGNVSLTDVSPAEPEEKTEDENGGEDEFEK